MIPPVARRLLLGSGLAAAVAFAGLPSPSPDLRDPLLVLTTDELREEIAEAEARARATEAGLALTEQQVQEATEQLLLIDRRLADAADNLAVAEGQLALGRAAAADAEAVRQVAERNLSAASALLTSAEQAVDAEEALLGAQVTTAYKYGSRRGSLAVRVLSQTRDPNDLGHRLHLLEAVMDWQGETLARVDELRDERQELTVAAAAAHDEAIGSRRDAASALQVVEQLAEQARDLEASVRAESTRQQQLLDRLEQDAAAKRSVLASLAAERSSIAGELARRTAAASVLDGVMCPNPLGAARFTNDWGFPRSGGRTHKGTDVFAARDTPLYAIKDGTIKKIDASDSYVVGSGRGDLGGLSVSLTVGPGEYWYFAHLESIAPGLRVGQQVTQGTLLGHVGNSGNAATTPTHTHIGRYVNGAAVNPFPSLAPVCLG